MSHDLTEPTLGYIVTPITWDGTNFHPLMSTVAGLLRVSVDAATEIVTHCMGLDGAAWVGMHVDATGDIQTDVLTIADGQIRCYGWTGAAWQRLKVTGAGLVQNEVSIITEGQVRTYLYDGGAWQRVKGLASGIAQVDIDSLRSHNDIIPMHFKEAFRHRIQGAGTGGNVTLNDVAVPAGETHVVTNVALLNDTSSCVTVRFRTVSPTVSTDMKRVGPTVATQATTLDGMFYLEPTAYMAGVFYGTTLGDLLLMFVHGYAMRNP